MNSRDTEVKEALRRRAEAREDLRRRRERQGRDDPTFERAFLNTLTSLEEADAVPSDPSQPMPPVVQLALRVLLRHVEPGWEHCQAVVETWLNGKLAILDMSTISDG